MQSSINELDLLRLKNPLWPVHIPLLDPSDASDDGLGQNIDAIGSSALAQLVGHTSSLVMAQARECWRVQPPGKRELQEARPVSTGSCRESWWINIPPKKGIQSYRTSGYVIGRLAPGDDQSYRT